MLRFCYFTYLNICIIVLHMQIHIFFSPMEAEILGQKCVVEADD